MVARPVVCVAGVVIAAALACSGKPESAAKKPMTEAQRDSAIGESALPGAHVVKKALEESDSAEVRANRPIPEPF